MSVRPSSLLTPEEVRRLRGKSDLVGAWLVLHCWGVILGAMALFAWWPNPLTFLIAVAAIGTRQLGLGILMHDAAHGLLFKSRVLNERVGQWLCAWPMATDLYAYRPYHLSHHRYTQQPNDPDLVLSAPFPISAKSLWRKAVRDLTGQTAYQRRRLQLLDALGPADLPWRGRLARVRAKLGGALLVNAVLCAGLAAAGAWWLYPALWLVPAATTHQLVSRIRNIAEHAVVPDDADPLRNTRTTRANLLERAFVAPYWVNYHLEHHLFLFVPCWRLPEAHRLLLAKGFGPKMEIQPGYLAVLRAATANANDGPHESVQARTGAAHI